MINRSSLILFVILLPGCLLFAAGCSAPRLSDTHNTTLLIGEYNTWAAGQNSYNEQVRTALDQMGTHLDAYNREIAKTTPDTGTLQANIAADRQLLGQWGTANAGLDSATTTFATNTASLDLSGDPSAAHLRELLLQEMKIYSIDMENARQHFIDYNQDLGKYVTADDPDYWNDALRTAALNAKSEGLASVTDGDAALSNITATAQVLQDRQ